MEYPSSPCRTGLFNELPASPSAFRIRRRQQRTWRWRHCDTVDRSRHGGRIGRRSDIWAGARQNRLWRHRHVERVAVAGVRICVRRKADRASPNDGAGEDDPGEVAPRRDEGRALRSAHKWVRCSRLWAGRGELSCGRSSAKRSASPAVVSRRPRGAYRLTTRCGPVSWVAVGP